MPRMFPFYVHRYVARLNPSVSDLKESSLIGQTSKQDGHEPVCMQKIDQPQSPTTKADLDQCELYQQPLGTTSEENVPRWPCPTGPP